MQTMVALENINKEELKKFAKKKSLVTFRVSEWIGLYTKQEISDMVGISRPTLNTRLSKHNWRMIEIQNVLRNMPF